MCEKLYSLKACFPLLSDSPQVLTVSVGVNRILRSQLVAVSPGDPLTLVAASALLVLFAAFGCYVPGAVRLPSIPLRSVMSAGELVIRSQVRSLTWIPSIHHLLAGHSRWHKNAPFMQCPNDLDLDC